MLMFYHIGGSNFLLNIPSSAMSSKFKVVLLSMQNIYIHVWNNYFCLLISATTRKLKMIMQILLKFAIYDIQNHYCWQKCPLITYSLIKKSVTEAVNYVS